MIEKSILVRFHERKEAAPIFVKEKKAKRDSLLNALELLTYPKSVEDLLDAADIVEKNGIKPVDIDAAIELFEADRGTADAYLQKAIVDIANIVEQRRTQAALIKEAYKYSSTQINFPPELAKKLMDWCNKNIPEEDVYTDPKDETLGKEDKPHVTVKYGLHTSNQKDIEDLVKGFGDVEINLGKVSIFEPEEKEYDVVKVEIEGDKLRELNKKLSDNLENSDEHPEYKPHATIAYVKKGQGKKYVGNTDFEGLKFVSHSLDFSSKTEDKAPEKKHTEVNLL